jgi:hypothetical protein
VNILVRENFMVNHLDVSTMISAWQGLNHPLPGKTQEWKEDDQHGLTFNQSLEPRLQFLNSQELYR